MPNEEVDDHSKSNPHDLYTKAYIGILNSYPKFNKEEDQTMSDIIKNIQEYQIRAVDSERALIRAEYDAAAVKGNSFIKQTVDEEIPPHSPNETSEQPENVESIKQ